MWEHLLWITFHEDAKKKYMDNNWDIINQRLEISGEKTMMDKAQKWINARIKERTTLDGAP